MCCTSDAVQVLRHHHHAPKAISFAGIVKAVLGPDFCCFYQVTMTKQGHIINALLFSYILYETMPTSTWHGMQVEVKVYHICFANRHCRHGKRQALERPVLGNLSKSREGVYKKIHSGELANAGCFLLGFFKCWVLL